MTHPDTRAIHAPSGGFWRRLRALTVKEFRQLLRDRSNLAIGVILPILLILLFGYGLSLDIRHANVAIVLEDGSPTARDVVAGLGGSDYIEPTYVLAMSDAEGLMRARQVDAIVRIPVDFSYRLAQGNATVQLVLHGTDAATAASLRAYVSAAIAGWGQRQADRAGRMGPAAGVQIIDRMWFNATNSSTWYLVPGLIVLIMTLVGGFLTSMVIAREWERGTMESLFVTPVRTLEILLAKIIPYFCVGLLGLLLCVAAALGLFALPLNGSLWVLLVSSMLYLIVALSLGLFISAAARNQFLASQIAVIATFLPALMLSGFLFDLHNVPIGIQRVASILPATYFVELAKMSFLAGDNFPLILRNWSILGVEAVVLITAAWLRTRKSLDH
ncbi:MAG: ABC transporter permease [Azonexus sp.]|jgi:ABC-2 type transport system permease protein|uniref:ABC transporter permease n=1 Tax=Azonexus sp. TaxID=1872668 RepID=UPI00282265EA|nr:ABC transporter permease [Azonexus sp.]MDR0776412.1 ABC transporter permease [Azonexus sp.]